MFSKKQTEEKTSEEWSAMEFLKFVLITIAIVLPIRFYVVQPFVVNGASMSPTFETGQYLIVDQLTYQFSDPKRGDVIIFRYPNEPSKFFIKRVIGLPGETITIDGEEIEILKNDGQTTILNEPYIELKKNSYLKVDLNANNFFVMGDNRDASLDSRIWGPLDKKYIVGRAYIRLLPINELDYLPGEFNFNN